jgi:hypothetical protein
VAETQGPSGEVTSCVGSSDSITRMYFAGAVLQGTHPLQEWPNCASRPGVGRPANSITGVSGLTTRPSRIRCAGLRPSLTAALCVAGLL